MTMEERIRAVVVAQVDPLIEAAAEERRRKDLENNWSDNVASFFKKDNIKELDRGVEYPWIVNGVLFSQKESMLCFRSDRAEAKLNGSPFSDGLNLYERLQDMFARIALAVNDSRENDYYDRSYSKSLFTALFKYGGKDSALIVKKLNLDTISLSVAVNGEELPCHPFIHFNEVSNKRILEEKLREAITHGAGEETSIKIGENDRISFWFRGYTIDVSQFNSAKSREIFFEKSGEGRKWCASYRADQEVLSDEPVSPEEKLSRVSTECVRILALFKIFMLDQACRDLYQYHRRYIVEKGLPTEAFDGVFSYMDSRVWALGIVRREWDDFCTKSEEKGVKYPRYDDYNRSNPKEPKKLMAELLDQLFRQNILLTDEALYIYAKRLLTGSAEEA